MSGMSRDAAGRGHGVAALASNLADLTDDQVQERIDSLGRHIGNLHTVWEPLEGWRAATPRDLAERDLPRWIEARIAALQERERRLSMFGYAPEGIVAP
jgi:hypothetical protein